MKLIRHVAVRGRLEMYASHVELKADAGWDGALPVVRSTSGRGPPNHGVLFVAKAHARNSNYTLTYPVLCASAQSV